MTIRRVVPNFRSQQPAENDTFYVDVLGFELAMDMHWIATFVSPTNPTAQVSLISEDLTAPVHPDVSVEVADLDETHRKAVEHGFDIVYPLTDEPWGARRFFVRDPNGVVVNVVSHAS